MTDTKLREARIARAKELTAARNVSMTYQTYVVTVANHLADLIEQDWRPEPEVDAVTLAAREWLAENTSIPRESIGAGDFDDWISSQAFRAGHAHALANHPDTRRMDWLDQCSWVGWSRSRPSAGAETSRIEIDRAMKGGEPTTEKPAWGSWRY